MSAKVEVTIDPKTMERKYEIEGVGGVECDQVTEALEQSNKVLAHEYTEEHNLPDLLPDYLTGE